MEYSISKKVQEAGLVLGAFGVIGFIGIVWLMIYGNLSGNLGFATDGITITNETEVSANTTGFILAGVSDVGATGYVITAVWNATTGGVGNYNLTIPLANVSVSSVGNLTNGTVIEYENVSVSYTYTRDSTGTKNTNMVIDNLTGGFLTFFGFSGTWFTIAAIILLIFMLVGLLAIVMNIAAMQGKGSGKYSGN